MAKFVVFTLPTGDPVIVNLLHIVTVQLDTHSGTAKLSLISHNNWIRVTETVDTVLEKITHE